MTYQTGMIAKDGILLASDTLRRITGLPGRPARKVYAKKIVIVKSKGLAYCCAGDDLAMALGEEIRTAKTAELCGDPHGFFIECCQRVIDRADPRPLYGGSVLAVLQAPALQLWEVTLGKASMSGTATLIEEQTVVASGGDPGNYAGFYLERYFPKQSKPPLSVLTRLAAHVVLEASNFSPSGIGGLEIVSCTASSFHRVSPQEIDELRSFSYKLADDIRRKFGVPRW